MTLILVGKMLEARARVSAGDASRALLERGAKEATVLWPTARADACRSTSCGPGTLVVVLPGEKIPADGVVQEGTSWVDLSLLTGESVPVDVGPGDEVVGAAINGHGRLVVFVTKVGANTKLAEIVRLLEAAQGSKAPVQRLADRVSAVFVPVVLRSRPRPSSAGSLCDRGGAGQALLHAVAVLLIACPVRARAGDAGRDHGRDRARGRARHPVQGRRGLRDRARAPTSCCSTRPAR